MANKYYDNYVLAAYIEKMLASKLDLMRFCTVDKSLTLTPGMKKYINRYIATSGTQILGIGEGNTQTIEASYTTEEYNIKLYQNRATYYDEHQMTDPIFVQTLMNGAAADLINKIQEDGYAEWMKAQLTTAPTKFNFDAFVDAASLLDIDENLEGMEIFGFVNPFDMGSIRKNLKDDLKYVEAFSRSGYVGTVGGINLYTKKNATKNTIIVGTKDAMTYFDKKGTEVERVRADANTRTNSIFTRKYGVWALTDARYAVKMQIGGTEKLTVDKAHPYEKDETAEEGS